VNLFTTFAHHWTSQFWSVSAQATLFIILAYAISVCLRRFPARYRYILWLFVMIRLAVPVSINSPLGIGQYPEQFLARGIQWISGQAVGLSYLHSETNMPFKARFWQSADDSGSLLCTIWLSGILVLGVVIVTRFVQLRRRTNMLVNIPRPDLISMAGQMTTRLGIKSKIRLLQAEDDIHFPSTHGIFRPTIILPGSMASEWTAQALEPVLLPIALSATRCDLSGPAVTIYGVINVCAS
jgi:beta-lactamase regulating signal transducer with metallopeptidase domain